jgi:hypothetical protein
MQQQSVHQASFSVFSSSNSRAIRSSNKSGSDQWSEGVTKKAHDFTSKEGQVQSQKQMLVNPIRNLQEHQPEGLPLDIELGYLPQELELRRQLFRFFSRSMRFNHFVFLVIRNNWKLKLQAQAQWDLRPRFSPARSTSRLSSICLLFIYVYILPGGRMDAVVARGGEKF